MGSTDHTAPLTELCARSESIGARSALLEAQLLLNALGMRDAVRAIDRHQGAILKRTLIAREARDAIEKARQS